METTFEFLNEKGEWVRGSLNDVLTKRQVRTGADGKPYDATLEWAQANRRASTVAALTGKDLTRLAKEILAKAPATVAAPSKRNAGASGSSDKPRGLFRAIAANIAQQQKNK